MTGAEQGTINGRPLGVKQARADSYGFGFGWGEEMNRACDEFFRKRGMPVFASYADCIREQKKRIYKHFRNREGKEKK